MVVMSAGSDVVFAYVSTTCVPEEELQLKICAALFLTAEVAQMEQQLRNIQPGLKHQE